MKTIIIIILSLFGIANSYSQNTLSRDYDYIPRAFFDIITMGYGRGFIGQDTYDEHINDVKKCWNFDGWDKDKLDKVALKLSKYTYFSNASKKYFIVFSNFKTLNEPTIKYERKDTKLVEELIDILDMSARLGYTNFADRIILHSKIEEAKSQLELVSIYSSNMYKKEAYIASSKNHFRVFSLNNAMDYIKLFNLHY